MKKVKKKKQGAGGVDHPRSDPYGGLVMIEELGIMLVQ